MVSRLNGDLLSKFILEDRIPVIVLALKDILSKDSISISTHLGKYKKSELLSMVDVDAAEFLAYFLIYTCAEVANRNGKDEKTNFITKDYVDAFESQRDSINIITAPVIRTQQL